MGNRKGRVYKLLDKYLKNKTERKRRRIIQKKFFGKKLTKTEEHSQQKGPLSACNWCTSKQNGDISEHGAKREDPTSSQRDSKEKRQKMFYIKKQESECQRGFQQPHKS